MGLIKSDDAFFVNSNNPWFIRGGAYNNGTETGVEAFNNTNGNANTNNSFRVVCADYFLRKSLR